MTPPSPPRLISSAFLSSSANHLCPQADLALPATYSELLRRSSAFSDEGNTSLSLSDLDWPLSLSLPSSRRTSTEVLQQTGPAFPVLPAAAQMVQNHLQNVACCYYSTSLLHQRRQQQQQRRHSSKQQQQLQRLAFMMQEQQQEQGLWHVTFVSFVRPQNLFFLVCFEFNLFFCVVV